MTIDRAIEVFVRGFSFTRSYTHPYLAEQIQGIWVMRDAERKRGDYRNEEWVAHGIEPGTLHAVASKHTRGRYVINVIRASDEPDELIRGEFKTLGYRLTTTEALMVHDLKTIEPFDGPEPIVRVKTQVQADLLAKETRRRQILPEHLSMDPSPIRQYLAMDGEEAVGWAASIVAGDATWPSNVFVKPAYRRRGIGRALLTRILEDDRAAEASVSVLLASHAGAKLYPTVGYRQIGELMMFHPTRG